MTTIEDVARELAHGEAQQFDNLPAKAKRHYLALAAATQQPSATQTLADLKRECRYHETPEESGEPEEAWDELGSTESLIAYKDALEELVYRLFGEVATAADIRAATDPPPRV